MTSFSRKEAIKERQTVVANFLAKRLNTTVDRWGHVKYIDPKNGKTYRYKIMTNVARLETKTSLGDWVLIKSYNLKNIESVAKKEVMK